MKAIVWLLGHKARVGKDTFWEIIKQHHIDNDLYNNAFNRYAFADKLKSVVGDLYDFTLEQMYGHLKDVIDERYNLTPRDILIKFGQEQRQVCPEIWPNYLFNGIVDDKIHYFINSFPNIDYIHFFIPDFRFKNEYGVAKKWEKNTFDFCPKQVVTVDITRPGLKPIDDISEKDLDDFSFDYTIENNGSLEDYKLKVIELFNKICQNTK